jgi:hypothetical protein
MTGSDAHSYELKICNTSVGPGGWNCACCAPAPGKGRKKARRTFKRRAKRENAREIRNWINEN